MSITNPRAIDFWAISDWEPGKVVLVITDHLEWGNKVEQGEHLLMLQEKLNCYVAFIESGKINAEIPDATGKYPTIRIIGVRPLPEHVEFFIDRIARGLKARGIGLEHVLKEE